MGKILIANRGEIASRIIKSAKKMGYLTVAVYSEADKEAKFVKEADEAYLLGPAPSSESYLNIDKIISIAKMANVDLIHPGYGFLSENADFAVALDKANVGFIGPNVEAIQTMGSKLAAKQAVKQYDIPMVPGTEHALQDEEEAVRVATEIGYPILIKASAGGGGKGMRIVRSESEIASQMRMAISEAKSAFGDGAVFIEKFVENPRHIEVQILADNYGNIIHVNERECSIQRRHQKVIEEAPGNRITPSLRQSIGQAAIDVARSCNYTGAGTVEFLMDADDNFYFLEMNTRLQVEHPVTEMTTGIDLVEWQIKIAEGEKLDIEQGSIHPQGHAIELRVYAEDPRDSFLPSIGKLKRYEIPPSDIARVDDAYEEGDQIPIYYDPMIAKLIVHADTREEAIVKMKKAIALYKIEDISTTLEFGTFVMNHPAFISGNYDTKFVGLYYGVEKLKEQKAKDSEILGAILSKIFDQESNNPAYIEDQKLENW